MKASITLPVLDADGRDSGIAVYVAISAWDSQPASELQLRRVADALTFHDTAGFVIDLLGAKRCCSCGQKIRAKKGPDARSLAAFSRGDQR